MEESLYAKDIKNGNLVKHKARRKGEFIGVSKQRKADRQKRNELILKLDHECSNVYVADNWTKLLMADKDRMTNTDKGNRSTSPSQSKRIKPQRRLSSLFTPTRKAKIKTLADTTLHPKFYPSLLNLIKSSPYLNDSDLKEFGANQNKDEPITGDVLNKCYQQIMQYEADYKSKPNQYKQTVFSVDEMINTPKTILERHSKHPHYIPIIEQVNRIAAIRALDETNTRPKWSTKLEEPSVRNKTRVKQVIRRTRDSNKQPQDNSSVVLSQESFPETASHPYEAFSHKEVSSPHNTNLHLEWDSVDRSLESGSAEGISGGGHRGESFQLHDSNSLTSDNAWNTKQPQFARTDESQPESAPHRPDTPPPPITDYTATDVVSCLVNMLSIQLQRDREDSSRFADAQSNNQQIALENTKYGQNNKLLLQNHLQSLSGASQSDSKPLNRPSSASTFTSHQHHINPTLHTLQLPKSRPTSAGIFGGISRGSNPVKPLTMTPLRPKSASAMTSEIERLKRNTSLESAGLFQTSTKVTKQRQIIMEHVPSLYWPNADGMDR